MDDVRDKFIGVAVFIFFGLPMLVCLGYVAYMMFFAATGVG
jgi:hypothetical protein